MTPAKETKNCRFVVEVEVPNTCPQQVALRAVKSAVASQHGLYAPDDWEYYMVLHRAFVPRKRRQLVRETTGRSGVKA